MTSIADIQRALQAFVLEGASGARDAVIGDGIADADERLAVYFEAYRLRLVRILADDFPGVRALTSDQDFSALALGYLAAHPSRATSVRWVGRDFAAYLRQARERTDNELLAEMAAFEWQRGRAFDAADAIPAGPEALAAIPAERWPVLCADFHPSFGSVTFGFNTDELWRVIRAGEMPLPAASRRPQPVTCAIWRRGLTVYWRVAEPDESAALAALADGRDFAQLCEVLCEYRDPAIVPERAAQLLGKWLADGMLLSVRA